jgi:hypothetical protein
VNRKQSRPETLGELCLLGLFGQVGLFGGAFFMANLRAFLQVDLHTVLPAEFLSS